MTTDRKKKPIHHNVTGMEYRGDTRGLAELPWQQLKCWMEISVATGVPLGSVGSKPQAGLSRLKHQSKKGTQITPSYEKWQNVYLPRRDRWRHREPLKGPTHKILFAATYPGIW